MIEFDYTLSNIFRSATECFKHEVKDGQWTDFFIDGVAYQAGWLGALRPELTHAYLSALAELYVTNGEDNQRAKLAFDLARRALMESVEAGAAERKPS